MNTIRQVRFCSFCGQDTDQVFSPDDGVWQCTRCTHCCPQQIAVYIPHVSLGALGKALHSLEGNSDWQVVRVADAIMATLKSKAILVCLNWTPEQLCAAIDVHITDTDQVRILHLPFSAVLPDCPRLCWNGNSGHWEGYEGSRSVIVEGVSLPARSRLMAELARELVSLQFALAGYVPSSPRAAKQVQGAGIVAGLLCGEGEAEPAEADCSA